jgi:beta-N-acetylhexosaminidase
MQFKIRYGLMLVVISSFFMCQSNIPNSEVSIIDELDHLQLIEQIQQAEAEAEAQWIDAKWESMTEEERLGQLFMVAAYTRNGSSDEARVKALIEKEHVGGLIMFQGSPERTAILTNKYQKLSPKVPLMIAIDGEWGVNMRLSNTIQYPRQLLMGAIQDNRIIYDFGKEVARQCRRLGIHVNFAPVVDVNNNASNPVIGDRSFGESRENVTAKAFQYMRGMQDYNVWACAKHFPGHGDTDVDSHYDLPIIKHSRARLDSIELYPFRSLIQHGVKSIMVAHLHIPAIDSTPNLPTTLSPKAINGILKTELQYDGLVFTDAMGMTGVTKHFANGEADLKAIQAGVDILLMSPDVSLAKKKIKAALAKGELKWDDLEIRIRKILREKYRLGLDKYIPVSETNVVKDLNNPKAEALYEKIIAAGLTLTRNPDNLIPIRRVREQKIASLSIGSGRKTYFQRELDRYGIQKHYYSGSSIVGSNKTRLLNSLKNQDVVLIGLHRVGKLPEEDFNLSKSARNFINELSQQYKGGACRFWEPL